MNKKKVKKITRREFIGKAAAAAAFTIVPRYVLGGTDYTAPSDKLNMACVGVGGSNSTSNPGPIYAHDTLPNVGYWKYFGKTMGASVVDMHYVAVTAHGDLA